MGDQSNNNNHDHWMRFDFDYAFHKYQIYKRVHARILGNVNRYSTTHCTGVLLYSLWINIIVIIIVYMLLVLHIHI